MRLPVAQRREQLLDAAIRIIARDGYEAVSIGSIAGEAGVTRPVIYSSFGGLDALLTALLDRSQQRALAALAEALPPDPDLTDPDGFLLAAVRKLIASVRDDPDIWRPILGLTPNPPAQVRDRIEHDREQIRSRLTRILESGLAARGGPDLDAEVVAHMLLAALEHVGRLALEDPPRFPADRLVSALGGLLSSMPPTRRR